MLYYASGKSVKKEQNVRTAEIERNTRETKIRLALDLDGEGRGEIDTGMRGAPSR